MGTGIPIDRMNDRQMKKFLEDHKDELDVLAAMSDEDIDFTDIPEMTKEDWKHAVRGLYFLPIEQRRARQKQMIEDCRSPQGDSKHDTREE